MKLSIDSISIKNYYPRLIRRGLDTYLHFQNKEEKIIYNSLNNKIELLSYPENFGRIALTPRSSKTSEEIVIEYLQNHTNYLRNNEFAIQIIESAIFIIFKNDSDKMIFRRID